MAEVNIDLRLNQGNVRQGLRQVQGQLSRTNGVLTSFLGNLAANAFTAFARGAITSFGDIFRSAIQIEQVGAQFRVLIGNAEQAEVALRSVSEFAARTPFANPEVERAATQLLAFGTTADQLTERLTDLGNIAGVANRSISEIATIFGQVNAQGRLTAERFNQLVEGGINLGDALASRLMIPVTNLRDAISRGAVSAEVFNQAITELGDRFQGIDALAQTLGGQLSTLGSNFELLRRNIGSEFTPALTDAVRVFNEAFAVIQPFARALARIVVNRVVTFIQDFRNALEDTTSTFNTIRSFLIEHRAIIIRIVTVYALYTGTLVAARAATIAYGLAVGLVSPVLTILRGALIASRFAVVGLTRAVVFLGGFLTTTFTAILGILLTPLGAISAAIIALGVVGTGFASDLAVAFIRAQRAGVQLAQAMTTTGIVIESTFREVGGTILRFIAPPLMAITRQLSSFIRAIPSAFRPSFLDRFSESLDRVDFVNLARDVETGESGLFAFNRELGRSDERLQALQTQLEMSASNTTFGETLSATFNETLQDLQNAATNNEFLGPIISQLSAFRMRLGEGFDTTGISDFVDSGRGLLDNLRMALVDGQIPAALQNLVSGATDTISNELMRIEDEESRAEKRRAESDIMNNGMKNARDMVQTAKEVTELQRRNQMIADVRLTAMEQLAIMEENDRIAEIGNQTIRDDEDTARIEAHEQNIIDIRFRFAQMRAMNEANANTRAVQLEQAQANQSVAIQQRASAARMRIQEAEQRSRMGYFTAINGLLTAGLQAEGVGVRERKGLAIAQATINAYAGASRAFVDYPYPASAAVAASVIATGLVQVHNITSTGNFQQGGIVGGNSFSGDRLTANVNSGELILNRAQQSNIAGQLRSSVASEGQMEARLASIERILQAPVTIQNANGQMFAELTREGVRDGVNING